MTALFIEYPPCSTCKKAKQYLKAKGIALEERHIVESTPSVTELKRWLEDSRLDIKRFFNTSGKRYQSLNIKEKRASMSIDEQLQLLSSDGMLIKRPIVIIDQHVLVGFKIDEYDTLLRTLL